MDQARPSSECSVIHVGFFKERGGATVSVRCGMGCLNVSRVRDLCYCLEWRY